MAAAMTLHARQEPAQGQAGSELPTEVLGLVYHFVQAAYGEHGTVPGLRDRLRGRAVCRAWRSALQELPYPAWRIATDTKGLAAELGWLVQARPSIRKLTISAPQVPLPDLLPSALEALCGQDLLELELRGDKEACTLLPTLASTFPHLTRLHADLRSRPDLDWAAALGALRALRELSLAARVPPRKSGNARLFVAPAARGLTRMELRGFEEVLVDLSTLPALAELTLEAWRAYLTTTTAAAGSGGGNDVAGGTGPAGHAAPASCRLRRLELLLVERRVGTSHSRGAATLGALRLPALESLELTRAEGLEGADCLSTATALTRLRMEGCPAHLSRQLLAETLPPEAALELRYTSRDGEPPLHELLPYPHDLLPALRALALPATTPAPWLDRLSRLTALHTLQLEGHFPWGDPGRQLFAAPAVPSLTRLVLSLPNVAALAVDLSRFPALRALDATADVGSVELTRPGARRRGEAALPARASRLTEVSITAGGAAGARVNFDHLPALRSLALFANAQLRGTTALCALPALHTLALGYKHPSRCPIAERLLPWVPPTVQSLQLRVHRPAQLAPLAPLYFRHCGPSTARLATCALPQLRALDIEVSPLAAGLSGRLPPELREALDNILWEGTPLWEGLEALALPPPLPEGLCGMPRLHLLRLRACHGTTGFAADILPQLPLLQTLPALAALQLECRCGRCKLDGADAERLVAALPALLPVTLVKRGESFLAAAPGVGVSG